MSTYRRSSASSTNSSVYSSSNTMSSASSYSSQPASIAALPSFAHSLSSFPTMTSVTSDMVHYGTGRTKQMSEAKLNNALQSTKQRQPGYPHNSLPSTLEEEEDDEQALVIPRRKAKASSAGAR